MNSPLAMSNNYGRALGQEGGKDGGNGENPTSAEMRLFNVVLPPFLSSSEDTGAERKGVT